MSTVRSWWLSAPWFLRYRWCAFAGQVGVSAAAPIVGVSLPGDALSIIFGALLLLNVLLSIPLRERAEDPLLIGSVLVLDTILLTAVLALSGGAMNPFTILYLVQVVLAAVMLGVGWTWTVAAVSSVCFGSLFVLATSAHEMHEHGGHGGLSMHLHGMLAAFLIAAGLTSLFLTRIVAERSEKESRLQRFATNQERLATLTTLAANAAHELGTPLNTIGLVVDELLERCEANEGLDAEVGSDLREMHGELGRCREAVHELVAAAGGMLGEGPTSVSADMLVGDAMKGIPAGARVEIDSRLEGVELTVPKRAVSHAIRILIKNAIDSGSPGVRVDCERGRGGVALTVSDSGTGMTPEQLARLGEPFFTTKTAGRGLGLGVFLVRLVSDRVGGKLEYESEPGRGTTARLFFPVPAPSGIDGGERYA